MLLMSYPTPINEDYIETKIIDGSIKNKQIDSIVCTVYTTEEYCEKEYQHLFRNIVLLADLKFLKFLHLLQLEI